MKIYIIYWVPAQYPYQGKFLFQRYWPKCSELIRLQDFLINHISKTNQRNSLIFCMLMQVHINEKLVKTFWVGMVKNEFGQFGHGTLKLIVYQEWTNGMNWFSGCWCKFRKAKSCFNDFWLRVVTNDHGLLVHETLTSAVSYEWIYELSWFFECLYWCSNFRLISYSLIFKCWGSTTVAPAAKHISNHGIKYDQYVKFFIWIVFFNNMFKLSPISLEYSVKALGLLQCFEPIVSQLLINNWFCGSYGSLGLMTL